MTTTQVRLLVPDDAESLFHLRRAALLDSPLAFSASPEDDRYSSPEAVRTQLGESQALVFGALNGNLVGMLGMYRLPQIKTAHIAMIWGVFVAPSARGQGVAAQLFEAAIAHARAVPGIASLQLSVNETTPGARRLYERMGFRVWGVEPDALRANGRSTSEAHMSLSLN
ncbi:RimJ/RimL family protein N-acetyltransferase [Povalibacter uvarum]|uniref:RimJ/RimL family protein N-acetyltransferase n=1 Tax=Povalibacter uvarum TaxID=732238 RepID=A0A841HVQ7_9GAMM|nr:GNAT family N-acetyltransferase [Povalibacter uvarum]MBB6095998.1 RimJ/RimL family protein N-acetyltransferase [Povalibacter uvarum]